MKPMKHWLSLLLFLAVLYALSIGWGNELPSVATAATDEPLLLTVGVVEGDDYRITSANPLHLFEGETARFAIEIDPDVQLRVENTDAQYANGMLTLASVKRSASIHLSSVRPCTLQIEERPHGRVYGSPDGERFLTGDSVTLTIAPDKEYVLTELLVNGETVPVDQGARVSIDLNGDTTVTPRFEGRPLSVRLHVNEDMGAIETENQAPRYADTVTYRAIDQKNSVFSGWSSENSIAKGGTLLSNARELTMTLTDDVDLYANYTASDAPTLTYDVNGGQTDAPLDPIALSEGDWLYLPIDDGHLTREGASLAGWSLSPTGEGHIYSMGAMFVMPATDVTLYAVWAEWTAPQYFVYEFNARYQSVAINGWSEKGKAAQITHLVLPERINGYPVTSIGYAAFAKSDALTTFTANRSLCTVGAYAFYGCPQLTRVVFFEKSLVSINAEAFGECPRLTELRVHANLSRVYAEHYDSAQADKYRRLITAPHPQIVLVGGSSLAFGLQSETIEAAYPGYSVVNFGTSVYYGMLPILDLLTPHLQEGDIVVMAPEYFANMYLAEETIHATNWQYLESNYDMLYDINIQTNRIIPATLTSYLTAKRSYLPGIYPPYGVYYRDYVNEYGDLICDRPTSARPVFAVPNASLLTDVGADRFNAFFKAMAERGVRCGFSFPPFTRGNYSEEYIQQLFTGLYTRVCAKLDHCTILGTPWDTCYAASEFYDQNYHMRSSSVPHHTQVIIDQLRKIVP